MTKITGKLSHKPAGYGWLSPEDRAEPTAGRDSNMSCHPAWQILCTTVLQSRAAL